MATRSQPAPQSAKTAYVIGSPTGFQAASVRYQAALSGLDCDPSIGIAGSVGKNAEKLAFLDDQELRRVKTMLPGLIIEPNLVYQHWSLLEGFEPVALPASGSGDTVEIVVSGNHGEPLEGVTVYLIVRTEAGRKPGYRGTTDNKGVSQFTVARGSRHFAMLALFPRHSYWSRFVEPVEIVNRYTVALRPLEPTRPEVYDWGHEFAGMTDGAANRGEHVRIGVIDSGVSSNHLDLKPIGGLNCVFNEDPARWHIDASGHGTHCAGVIAALLNGYGLKGYAPGADIISYRVMSSDSEGIFLFDVLTAINRAIEDECDIISMSFGVGTAQTLLRARIEVAYEHGVLCVAANGNQGGPVSFPAAFPHVHGVTAFGKFGAYPADSYHRHAESGIRSPDGQYYMANFSNFGSQVEFCAPGVAIRSTVPDGYLALDGTSMACPQITGLAALALAAHPDLRKAPRDAERVERLVQVLRESSDVMGFGSPYEGAGFPRIERLLRGKALQS